MCVLVPQEVVYIIMLWYLEPEDIFLVFSFCSNIRTVDKMCVS